MKKIIALFLSLIYFFFASSSYALADNLYFVKNSNIENIKPTIISVLKDKSYTINKENPYYAISSKNNNNYILIILQKSSENYFYYINSNHNNGINKNILKALGKMNVVYEESFNQQYLSMFEKQAQKVLSNTVGYYSFAEETSQNSTQTVTNRLNTNTLTGSVAQISKGSKFKVYLETPVNTSNASAGDEVRAVLSENMIAAGAIVAPQGSLLTGKITYARHATVGSMNGKVIFNFNTLTTPDGKQYGISTENIDFTVTNEGKWSNASKTLLVGAATGAVVGLLIGCLSKDTSTWKSTAISTGAGLTASAIKVAAERGIDAEIPVYTEVEMILVQPFSTIINY